MKVEFDHVGILVSDVAHALNSLQPHNWIIGDIAAFPSEGTKEVYIGPISSSGRLLLIEPIGEGPYKDALARRGLGLHHIAINVDDAMAFTDHISGSGWYLHPQSLRTFKQYKTLWLARPGVPMLVEIVQRKLTSKTKKSSFIKRIDVPLPKSKPLLTRAIGLEHLQSSSEQAVFITIDDERKKLEDFIDIGN